MPLEIRPGTIEPKKEVPQETRSGMVTIGCKHPFGLVLELDESRMEAPTPGANPIKVHYPTGAKYTLNGSNASHPDSPQNGGRVVAGYGLTDIPEAFWVQWTAQHPKFPMLEKGTLFVHSTQDGVTSEANNRRSVKTGTEPMDPSNPGPGLARDNGKDL